MTPKEKAEELKQEMFLFIPIKDVSVESALITAKYCAIAACKHVLNTINREDNRMYSEIKYWEEVKIELESL